ncbi:MAG: NTP transferase domain-containing protein [Candidatus Omnitrophica bacterium]|nr:NTP transferase domain-containing protein [Candidatus Omnitrophota bacterium]
MKKNRCISAVVLAAGKGVRMKSKKPKVLIPLCGRTLLDTVIDNLLKVNDFKEIVIVLNKELLFLKRKLEARNQRIKVAIQLKPLGTADALKSALSKVAKAASDIFVINADVALFKVATIKRLIDSHMHSLRAATLLSAVSESPAGYGRVIRNKTGQVERITEEIDLCEEEKQIGEINSGIYCFKKGVLGRALGQIRRRKNKNEYYLTDAIGILLTQGVGVVSAQTLEEILGINSAADLAKAARIMSSRIVSGFLAEGVKIMDPANTYIEANVKIGTETVIYPFTYIETQVVIGKDCSIGPFARLRKDVHLDDNVTVGNFVELSRTRVGSGTIIKHFGYLGDCSIGKKVNVGAGSVTANFDGLTKHKTHIEDGAFIGCDTVLIAPVKVGKTAVTGAGSVLVKKRNVPKGKVAVGVPARIINKKRG